jgi:hypothetical protein
MSCKKVSHASTVSCINRGKGEIAWESRGEPRDFCLQGFGVRFRSMPSREKRGWTKAFFLL